MSLISFSYPWQQQSNHIVSIMFLQWWVDVYQRYSRQSPTQSQTHWQPMIMRLLLISLVMPSMEHSLKNPPSKFSWVEKTIIFNKWMQVFFLGNVFMRHWMWYDTLKSFLKNCFDWFYTSRDKCPLTTINDPVFCKPVTYSLISGTSQYYSMLWIMEWKFTRM